MTLVRVHARMRRVHVARVLCAVPNSHWHAPCYEKGPTLTAQLQLAHEPSQNDQFRDEGPAHTARQDLTIHTVNEAPKGAS